MCYYGEYLLLLRRISKRYKIILPRLLEKFDFQVNEMVCEDNDLIGTEVGVGGNTPQHVSTFPKHACYQRRRYNFCDLRRPNGIYRVLGGEYDEGRKL